MNKEQFEILADRFICNEMEPDERLLFCQEMEKDEELRKFVSLRKLIIEGELIAAEEEAMLTMKQLSTSKHENHYRWIVAACISILIIGGGIFGYSYKYDTSYIYDTYSFIPPIERSRSGGGLKGEVADINDRIVNLYDKDKYKEVIDAISRASSEVLNALPSYSSLYIAISLLETNQPQKAISILSHLSETEYKEEVEWLQLCAYLRMDKRIEATNIARIIIARKGYYSPKAALIMKIMNEKRWF